MRMKGFNAVGHGPVVNGVEIQYSCGKEGYQNITASYSRRRKGYAKPEHSLAFSASSLRLSPCLIREN